MDEIEIRRYGDTEIQRYKDTDIQRYRDTEIQRYRDTEIQRYGDTEIEAVLLLYLSVSLSLSFFNDDGDDVDDGARDGGDATYAARAALRYRRRRRGLHPEGRR